MNSFKIDQDKLLIVHERLVDDLEFRRVVTKSFKGKRDWKVRVDNGPGLVISNTTQNENILEKLNETYFSKQQKKEEETLTDDEEESEEENYDSDHDSVIDDRLDDSLKTIDSEDVVEEEHDDTYVDVFILRKKLLKLEREFELLNDRLNQLIK